VWTPSPRSGASSLTDRRAPPPPVTHRPGAPPLAEAAALSLIVLAVAAGVALVLVATALFIQMIQ